MMKLLTMKMSKKKSKGQSLAEYGLILALIACACIAALTALGQDIDAGMSQISGAITGAIDTGTGGGGGAAAP
ncbi:MAG: hypothetical protein VKJ04_07765 [Vampirovibrionales bacterium]|nr:hypothetical protein [Vampirovibrionales bacterium]